MTDTALAPGAPAPGRATGSVAGSVGTVGRCSQLPTVRRARPSGADLPAPHEPGEVGPDFAAFFDRMLPLAVGVARRILTDQASAEDAAAEALARAYLRWPTLRASEYREAWVVRVTTNEALGMVRKRNRRDRILRRQRPPDPAAAADAALRDGALADQVRGLPRRQREVVALRYFAEMSTEEVAAALDISPGSVKTHLHRAVAALRAEGRGGLGEALDA